MYRNARDFCVLISCPVTLLHSLISSGNILVESLEFSMYSICHLQIEFYFFFSDLDSFYFFLFSDCCGWDFKNYVNSSCKSGHPCLFPDLRGNDFSFLPLRIMFAVGLLCVAFIMLRCHAVLSCFSRVQLCDPMDYSPPGSSVHGILQARILKWVAISFSRGSS